MRTHHRSYKLVQVSRFLKKDRVVDLKSTTKKAALEELVGVLTRSVSDGYREKELHDAILAREAKISTGVGIGIALPHARLEGARDFAIAIGRSRKGIAYESFDGEPVHLIFMIVSPAQECCMYLNIHAKLALLMSGEDFRARLLRAKDSVEIYQALKGK